MSAKRHLQINDSSSDAADLGVRIIDHICVETHSRETRMFAVSVALLTLFILVSIVGLATRRPVVGGPATALAVLFWKTFRASVTTGNEANTALLEGLKTLKLPDTAAEIPHQELKDVPSVVTAAPRAAPTICGSAEATEPDQHPPQFDHRAKTSIRKRIELDERYQPVCVAATVSGFSESSWGADYNRTVWGANSSGMTPVHQTNEVRLKS